MKEMREVVRQERCAEHTVEQVADELFSRVKRGILEVVCVCECYEQIVQEVKRFHQNAFLSGWWSRWVALEETGKGIETVNKVWTHQSFRLQGMPMPLIKKTGRCCGTGERPSCDAGAAGWSLGPRVTRRRGGAGRSLEFEDDGSPFGRWLETASEGYQVTVKSLVRQALTPLSGREQVHSVDGLRQGT